jgi:hypothetical protein
MVVFVDLEGEDEELQNIQHSLARYALTSKHTQKLIARDSQSQYLHADVGTDDCASNDHQEVSHPIAERCNPNINGFSAALSCYP